MMQRESDWQQSNYNLHTDDDWKGNSGNGNGNNKDNTGNGNKKSTGLLARVLSLFGLDEPAEDIEELESVTESAAAETEAEMESETDAAEFYGIIMRRCEMQNQHS